MRKRPCPLGTCVGLIMIWMSTVVRMGLSRGALTMLVHRVVQRLLKSNNILGYSINLDLQLFFVFLHTGQLGRRCFESV